MGEAEQVAVAVFCLEEARAAHRIAASEITDPFEQFESFVRTAHHVYSSCRIIILSWPDAFP
jgi:hypothetical protein